MTQEKSTSLKIPRVWLDYLPFYVFLLVADADSNIDIKEVNEFLNIIRNGDSCKSQYAKRTFTKTAESYNFLCKQLAHGKIKKDMEIVRKVMTVIINKLPPIKAQVFGEDFWDLAIRIAKASGGIFHIHSISKEEKEVLNKLRIYFIDLPVSKNTKKKDITIPKRKKTINDIKNEHKV